MLCLSHKQYFLKHRFLDICRCVFKKGIFFNAQLEAREYKILSKNYQIGHQILRILEELYGRDYNAAGLFVCFSYFL